ncbi:MAG TPA: outer membrane beta-barrel domain-containing protein [Kofleriaceae bacterium]|nr:outer membrane beta-barrel domain-containing protein [Kofleriaceae bacterium]
MKSHTVLAVLAVLAVSAEVYAEGRRQNTLATDVAVRRRRLLVKNRFELAPLFESTINADFRHIVGGGAKLEYHLGDMLSIGVVGVYSTALDTKLVDKIRPTLEMTSDPKTREPSQAEFMDRLNKMPLHGAAYVSLTPWYGKLAAFSQAYVAFDFYFQAGLSFAQLKSDCPTNVCNDNGLSHLDPGTGDTIPPDNNPNNDRPLNDGNRIGLYLGGGIHVFLNDFLALDMTVRDYAFTDNPSGADFNADLLVSNADNRFLHHLFFGVGISVMLPTTVKRTP